MAQTRAPGLRPFWLCILATGVVSGWYGTGAATDPVGAQDLEFFEKKVRPLLVEHCYSCHSGDAEVIEGGLRVDGREQLLRGGDSGAAIVPGNAEQSRLVKAVRYQAVEMPPQGKLHAAEIDALVAWIERGAPWPEEPVGASAGKSPTWQWEELQAGHWSWKPLREPLLPDVEERRWPQTPLDRFVLARRERAGLAAVPPADRRVLARRLYLDLTGLPPTPIEVADFVTATEPDMDTRLIDRLLASPRYGERWGRQWLDVARYSDGYGGFLDSQALPEAWRYRDWVVQALNQDLPYDQFVRYQIAGDLLRVNDSPVAAGFFAVGPTYHSDGGDPDSVAQAKSETLDDRVDTLSRAFLGLTVACARCHDHKFDPIPTMDYYSLAGIFNNTRTAEFPLASDEVVLRYQKAQNEIKLLTEQIKKQEKTLSQKGQQAADTEKEKLNNAKAKLAELREAAPKKYPVAHSLTDTGNADMRVALRGNLRKPGEIAPRRFLRILAGKDPRRFARGSGRVELADAVVGEGRRLTARVWVNRLWQGHFSTALVDSASNFGRLGSLPTHPGLLEWLAARLVRGNWSTKAIHRLIVSSSTYQMGSQFISSNFSVDGGNQLYWRKSPRRLDVESWRDALLHVTGELNCRIGGGPDEQVRGSRRRTLYFSVSRHGDRFETDKFLRLFDFPVPRATIAKRAVSVVPQQFLFLMNSAFMLDRAKAFAARIAAVSMLEDERIRSAYRLLYCRLPTEDELRIGRTFLAQAQVQKGLTPWEQYSQTLLSANEFMYLR
ncbi:MAG: hypothetical protein CMJ75_06320 [Planctomycetaceae bacterium]|nr:hypothetical protein [Planctomycetaceae bacterium]